MEKLLEVRVGLIKIDLDATKNQKVFNLYKLAMAQCDLHTKYSEYEQKNIAKIRIYMDSELEIKKYLPSISNISNVSELHKMNYETQYQRDVFEWSSYMKVEDLKGKTFRLEDGKATFIFYLKAE